MKLEQIKDALNSAESRFGLDGTDLKILGEWLECKRVSGFATIMFFITEAQCASQATTHARIKKLCDKNILKKVDNPANLRYKHLEKGSEFDKVVKLLERV
jgi:DNA-binding MarR family transcriptional regulator